MITNKQYKKDIYQLCNTIQSMIISLFPNGSEQRKVFLEENAEIWERALELPDEDEIDAFQRRTEDLRQLNLNKKQI